MTTNGIYTSPEEAARIIKERWDKQDLKEKAEQLIGRDNLPDYFFSQPHAISIEDLASPNLSCISFRDAAKKMDLEPLHFEYLDDLFVTTNLDKSALAKMMFYHGRDDKGDMITSVERVIDLSGKEEKKKIKDISTLWGENFADFHHRIFLDTFPNAKIFDGTDWYKSKGERAIEYYKYVFAMGICHGVLFEVFFDNGYEEKFTEEVALPAFEFARDYFGVKPLVSPIIPLKSIPDSIAGRYWWCYPEYIKIKI